MNEGFRGERGGRSPETPEQALRELARAELRRIAWESGDELARALAEKALIKLDIKDRVADIQRYQDDVTVRQDMKKLGSFVVIEQRSRFDIKKGSSSGLELTEGEPYLDIHVPPLSDQQKTLSEIRHSFQLLADYIRYHNIEYRYIIGVTYEQLAKVSQRYGFTVVGIDVPKDIARGVQNVYQDFNSRHRQDKKIGEIKLTFQKVEDFLDTFSPTNGD